MGNTSQDPHVETFMFQFGAICISAISFNRGPFEVISCQCSIMVINKTFPGSLWYYKLFLKIVLKTYLLIDASSIFEMQIMRKINGLNKWLLI